VIEQEEALARILSTIKPLPSREVELARAVGCFTARDVFARVSLPPFDNSAMDGYALVSAACEPGTRLRIVGEQPAGADRNLAVRAGEAIRILTGAPLPHGADAVVMQEDVTVDGEWIVLNTDVTEGEFVRRRGGDVAAGQKLLAAGDRIVPQAAGLLASQGLGSLEVGGQVRAAVLSTGDELVPPGVELQAGQIYDSNSVLLRAMLEACGADVVLVTHCADRADEIEAAFRAGTKCDVMLVTGGVSVGARDLVKPSLAAIGATVDLWRVAVKPGKPFLFGRTDSCSIFGLPGNPVSAFVTFLLFVRPALVKLMGANESGLVLPQLPARLSEEIHNDGNRPHYVRGNLCEGVFAPVGRQESHALFGLARSNALLLVRPGERVAAGAPVNIFGW
jgi:molybdopterin molybdotransferase